MSYSDLDKTTNQEQSYYQEEVIYNNNTPEGTISLSGTLTLPQKTGTFPAVVLIAGMGPNDRDYTMLDHKLFLVLADYLTKQGIAVLRYDKRGVGKSTGTFDLTLTSKDFASDALAGVAYLKTRKEIDPHNIGLLGHSEGAIIAPMVALQSPDVAFLVLLAGAASTNIKSIIEHVSMQLQTDGASDKLIAADRKIRTQLLTIVKEESDLAIAERTMRKAIQTYLQSLPSKIKADAENFQFAISEINYDDIITMFNSPWYRYFLSYEPTKTLEKITIPVLALNGDLDFITASNIALPIIAQTLEKAGNKHYKIVELAHMNHWFQRCKTGALTEYGQIKESINPMVLEIIAAWILKTIQ